MANDMLQTFFSELSLAQILGTGAAILVGTSLYKYFTTTVRVPAYGSEIPFLYQKYAWKYFTNAREIVLDGYKKYPIFKVPELDGWLVVISGGKLADEFIRMPDDHVSFMEFINQFSHVEFNLDPKLVTDHWHVNTIRGALLRNLGEVFKDMMDEVSAGFESEIDAKPGGEYVALLYNVPRRSQIQPEWKQLRLVDTFRNIVCRVSNRAFVGRPLCYDREWMDLNVTFTIDAFTSSTLINMFPMILQPLVKLFLTRVKKAKAKAVKKLGPIIEERLRLPRDERPNDMLTWLMDEAPEEEKTDLRILTIRVLATNFAAIHTTSMTFTHVFHRLVAYPEYLEPLREEITAVVEQYGWTKNGMAALHRLDSFIRETQRVSQSFITLARTAVKSFYFSDGTYIPAGTKISCVARAVHEDERLLDEALEFKPFRHVEARDDRLAADDLPGTGRFQMVNTSMQHMAFGHGKHACPGRFFASNELKCLLAYLIINYDFKWATEGLPKRYIPPDLLFGSTNAPNPDTEILIRKRSVDSGVAQPGF